MAKMPLIADPRYSMDENKSKEMERSLREDVSMTFRQPYPQEHEIGLPRIKMVNNTSHGNRHINYKSSFILIFNFTNYVFASN
jgi:hypothetical protein